jgi:cephalosporin-C deacetylase
MPLWDLPLEELERYAPSLEEPPDFDVFWAKTLAETRSFELDVRLEPTHCSPASARGT